MTRADSDARPPADDEPRRRRTDDAREDYNPLREHVAPPDASADEHVYFEGSPRIRGEMGKVAGFGLLGLLLILSPFLYRLFSGQWPLWWVTAILIVIGIGLLFIPWLYVRSIRFRISNYRIDYERGIFSRSIDTMELWHVDDIKYHQSLLDRMLNVGTITVLSDDQTTPELSIQGIPNPRPVFDALKGRIIAVKRQRGVIKMDTGD